MKFTVLTLFPEIFELYLAQTIMQRASELGIVEYKIVNIRDYSGNKHNQVDDIPFGGGAGMVLKPEPYWNYFEQKMTEKKEKKGYVIFVTPQGKQLTHEKVIEISNRDDVTIISGRYEGLDQRVIDEFVDEEILLGAFSAADLFLFMTYEENEGIVVLESLSTKLPILLRDIPVYNGWLEDGKNCLKAKTTADFIEKLEMIVNNKVENIEEIKENGREVARTRDLAEVGKKYKEYYEHILEEFGKK